MTGSSRDDAIENIFREYALRYFQIHADQRMRVFQFYIAISTALLGVGAFMIKQEQSQEILVFAGLFMAFVSFIFWKLDVRVKGLIKNAEVALKFLDDRHELPDFDGGPNPLKLFARDDFLIDKRKSEDGFLKLDHFSYGRCFNWVFAVVGVLGFLGALAGVIGIAR